MLWGKRSNTNRGTGGPSPRGSRGRPCLKPGLHLWQPAAPLPATSTQAGSWGHSPAASSCSWIPSIGRAGEGPKGRSGSRATGEGKARHRSPPALAGTVCSLGAQGPGPLSDGLSWAAASSLCSLSSWSLMPLRHSLNPLCWEVHQHCSCTRCLCSGSATAHGGEGGQLMSPGKWAPLFSGTAIRAGVRN